VLNTEAHPFPRFDPGKKRFGTGWKRLLRNEKGEVVAPNEKEKKEEVNTVGMEHEKGVNTNGMEHEKTS
jgi:hypothetical protein